MEGVLAVGIPAEAAPRRAPLCAVEEDRARGLRHLLLLLLLLLLFMNRRGAEKEHISTGIVRGGTPARRSASVGAPESH